MNGGPRRLPQRYLAQDAGTRAKAYAYLLGMVAILAGLAILVFHPNQLIDFFGVAALFGGLGAMAWAMEGTRFLKEYLAILLAAALVGGAIILVNLISGR